MLLDYDMPSLVRCAPISGMCNKNVHLRIDNVICFFLNLCFTYFQIYLLIYFYISHIICFLRQEFLLMHWGNESFLFIPIIQLSVEQLLSIHPLRGFVFTKKVNMTSRAKLDSAQILFLIIDLHGKILKDISSPNSHVRFLSQVPFWILNQRCPLHFLFVMCKCTAYVAL